MNEAEARRRFADARVGRLATVRPDGRPHVVPFVFAVDGDTCYWAIDAKPKSTPRIARLTNIEANSAAEAVVDSYDVDWRNLWWVRATGRARIVADGDEAARALDLLAAKYPGYASARPAGPVVAIDIGRWTWWDATPDPAHAT